MVTLSFGNVASTWRVKQHSLFLILTSWILLLLSACGNQSSGQSSITLKMITWNNPASVEATGKINDAFHQKYPSITVQLDTADVTPYMSQLLPTRLAANDVDLFADFGLVGSPPTWATDAPKQDWQTRIESGLVADLSGQPFLQSYPQQALRDAAMYKGKVYAIPTGMFFYTGIFYNKELFAQYHLQVPTTFQQFLTLCQQLKAKGIAPLTIGGKDGWPPLLTCMRWSMNSPSQNAPSILSSMQARVT